MYRLSAAGAGSALSVKVLATVVAVTATAGVAGLGTYATFESTTSADLPTTSGIVSIALGAAGADNRLTVSASNLVPGDTLQRAFKLTGASTDEVASIALTTSAPTVSSVLNTDATNGLQMVLEHCSVAWTESAAPYTYTCSGTTTEVVASRAVIAAGLDLKALAAAAGVPLTLASATSGTDNFRVTLTLPAGAGNTFQNRSSTIRFAFTATQRALTNK